MSERRGERVTTTMTDIESRMTKRLWFAVQIVTLTLVGALSLFTTRSSVRAADEVKPSVGQQPGAIPTPSSVDNAAVAPVVDSALIPVTPVIPPTTERPPQPAAENASKDYSSLVFVFMLATFIGLGVILRVSRLLHTPLMSLTNAISAIAVVGSIIVTGSEGNPSGIRFLGAIALFASMTNIVSGFLITDRMLKMFKSPGSGGKQ